jgi:hypothetical protein
MIYTFQTGTRVFYTRGPATTSLSVADSSGYTTYYSYTVLGDGSARLSGCIDIEDSASRQAAQVYLTYQLVPSSAVQVQRLSNGIMEVFDPAEPIHVGGNCTRYFVMNGQVSSTSYIPGTGPNSYVAQANAFLSSHNF